MAYGTLDNQCHADAYGQPFRRNDNATKFGVISDSQSLFCLWRRKQFWEIWLCITMFIQSVQTSGKKEGRFTEIKLRVEWQKWICTRLTDAVLLHQKALNSRSTWLYHVITGQPSTTANVSLLLPVHACPNCLSKNELLLGRRTEIHLQF